MGTPGIIAAALLDELAAASLADEDDAAEDADEDAEVADASTGEVLLVLVFVPESSVTEGSRVREEIVEA